MLVPKIVFSFCLVLTTVHALISQTTEDAAVTALKARKNIYTWTIEDFDHVPHNTGDFMESTIFSTKSKDFEWKLLFYPNGINSEVYGYTSLYLQLQPNKNDPTPNHRVNCSAIIFGEDGTFGTGQLVDTFKPSRMSHGFIAFTSRSNLLKYYEFGIKPFKIRVEVHVPVRLITEAEPITRH